MNEPRISASEAQQKIAATTRPKVTKELIQSKIAHTNFVRNDTLTLCVITMSNGYKQVGQSACADPANYNQDIGERLAFDDAFRGLWALEGYLLCEQLRGK